MQKQTNCKCGELLTSQYAEKDKLYYFFCESCKVGGKGATISKAETDFKKRVSSNVPESTDIAIIEPPKKQAELSSWAEKHMPALMDSSARFIEKPATKRMIEKNIKYAMTADFKDAWKTPEGQESIVDALVESLNVGATLPEMGSIVPFGKSVEFIPDIAAYQFALTSGRGAPLKDISIDCLYENDQYEMSRDDGNFHFKITKMGMPRGEVIGVVVQAYDVERGKIIGEAYDEKRLMEKAKRHSKNYQYFLNDMHALKKAEAEGKKFIIKFGDKKIYEKDIKNPYVGADKPEMLKKVAGKTFFRPYMKTRNSRAMAEEWQDHSEGGSDSGDGSGGGDVNYEKILDNSISNIKDAEIYETPDDVPEVPAPETPKREATKTNEANLFDEGL